jgi:hypothetical protein
LKVAKDGEGKVAFKGFSFSMDARVSIMRTTAAANGKRNRELDRRAWGMSVFGAGWGLSEDMKKEQEPVGEPAQHRQLAHTESVNKISHVERIAAAERVRGRCGVGLCMVRNKSEPYMDATTWCGNLCAQVNHRIPQFIPPHARLMLALTTVLSVRKLTTWATLWRLKLEL